jgi:hypothetical protein
MFTKGADVKFGTGPLPSVGGVVPFGCATLGGNCWWVVLRGYTHTGATPRRNFMSRKFTIPLLTAAFLVTPGLVLTADHASAQSVNYNTSK